MQMRKRKKNMDGRLLVTAKVCMRKEPGDAARACARTGPHYTTEAPHDHHSDSEQAGATYSVDALATIVQDECCVRTRKRLVLGCKSTTGGGASVARGPVGTVRMHTCEQEPAHFPPSLLPEHPLPRPSLPPPPSCCPVIDTVLQSSPYPDRHRLVPPTSPDS